MHALINEVVFVLKCVAHAWWVLAVLVFLALVVEYFYFWLFKQDKNAREICDYTGIEYGDEYR